MDHGKQWVLFPQGSQNIEVEEKKQHRRTDLVNLYRFLNKQARQKAPWNVPWLKHSQAI